MRSVSQWANARWSSETVTVAGLARIERHLLERLELPVGHRHRGVEAPDVHLHDLAPDAVAGVRDVDRHHNFAVVTVAGAARRRGTSTRTSCTRGRARSTTVGRCRACRSGGTRRTGPRRTRPSRRWPGKLADAGLSSSRRGYVVVRRPDASTSPNSTAARAAPASCPRYDIWTIAATSSAQSIVDGRRGVDDDDRPGVDGRHSADELDLVRRQVHRRGVHALGLAVVTPTTTTATSALAAACTARSIGVGLVGRSRLDGQAGERDRALGRRRVQLGRDLVRRSRPRARPRLPRAW